jgi:hypothetical protein
MIWHWFALAHQPAFIALNLSGHSAKTFGAIMKIAVLSVPFMIAGSIIVEDRQRHELLHCPSLAVQDYERRRERQARRHRDDL